MNDEVGNFLIKFTTEGFDKVEKSLNDLNKGMEKLNESFEKGTGKGESFFGALVKWDVIVGTITKSFRALRNEVSAVFNVAEDMTTLFRKEQILGVESKVLERYGQIAELNQGSQQDAYAFFEGIQNLMLKASTPALWGESDAKDLALAGINWSYQRLSSDKTQNMILNREAFLVALRQAFLDNMDDPDRMSYLKKYVGQESLYSWFMSPDDSFRSQLDWAEGQRVFSAQPEKLQDVQDLRVERLEWQNFWKKFDLQLTAPMTSLLKALEPLQKPLDDLVKRFGVWVDENADKIAGWIEDGAKWLVDEGPNILKGIGEVCTAIGDLAKFLAPVVSWAVKNVGGSLDFVGDVWKVMTGGMSWGDIESKYEKEGGGIFGWGLRGGNALGELLSTPTSAQVEWARNYNTTNNYGGNVTVEAGWHPETRTINPNNLTGAVMGTLRK